MGGMTISNPPANADGKSIIVNGSGQLQAGGGWVKIGSVTTGVAGAISLTPIDTTNYDYLFVLVKIISVTGDTSATFMQFNGDSAANYPWTTNGTMQAAQGGISLPEAGAAGRTKYIGINISNPSAWSKGVQVPIGKTFLAQYAEWTNNAKITRIDVTCGTPTNLAAGCSISVFGWLSS